MNGDELDQPGMTLVLAGNQREDVGDLVVTPLTCGASVFLKDGRAFYVFGIGGEGLAAPEAISTRLAVVVDEAWVKGLRSTGDVRFVVPVGLIQEEGRTVGFAAEAGVNSADVTLLDYLDAPKNSLPNELLALPARVRIARTVAQAFNAFHSIGGCVGTFDPSKVRISTGSNLVTFENAWAFGAAIGSGKTHAPLGVLPMYRPREVRAGADLPSQWGIAQDRFLLAVVLFQLLSAGRHPFAPVLGHAEDERDVVSRVQRGLYWPRLVGAPWMPPALAKLFELALEGDRPEDRPSAQEWVSALEVPGGRSGYDRCLKGSDRQHGRLSVFAGHACPLCDPYADPVQPVKHVAREATSPAAPVDAPIQGEQRPGIRASVGDRQAVPAVAGSGARTRTALVVIAALIALIVLLLVVFKQLGPRDVTEAPSASSAPEGAAPSPMAASAVLPQPAPVASAPAEVRPSPAPPPARPEPIAARKIPANDLVLPSWPRNSLLADVAGRDPAAVRIEINQVFAERGRRFSDALELHLYFSRFSWYQPSSSSFTLDRDERAKTESLRVELSDLQRRIGGKFQELDRAFAGSKIGGLPREYGAQIDVMLRESAVDGSAAFVDAWLWLKGNEPLEEPGTIQDSVIRKVEAVSDAKVVADVAAAKIDYANLRSMVTEVRPRWSTLSELALAGNKLGVEDAEVLYWGRRGVMARPSQPGAWIALAVSLTRVDPRLAAGAFCTALRISNGREEVRRRVDGHANDEFGQGAKVAEAARAGLAGCRFTPVAF